VIRRLLIVTALLSVVTASCNTVSVTVTDVDALEPIDPAGIAQILAASPRPVLLNVWASWCGPCRSEAPLLRSAHAEHGAEIEFIGIDVRDSQSGAQTFIADFGLNGFTHYFDAAGAVPANLGGFGVPLTFFFAPGGDLIYLHSGVIDERTLALQIDEMQRR
jgi:cytochrome c biogenesis protein CcmG/thiol:disulfide interchange protein DsbE